MKLHDKVFFELKNNGPQSVLDIWLKNASHDIASIRRCVRNLNRSGLLVVDREEGHTAYWKVNPTPSRPAPKRPDMRGHTKNASKDQFKHKFSRCSWDQVPKAMNWGGYLVAA